MANLSTPYSVECTLDVTLHCNFCSGLLTGGFLWVFLMTQYEVCTDVSLCKNISTHALQSRNTLKVK